MLAQGAFDGSLPFGKRPALIVIDMVEAYLQPGSPLYAGIETAVVGRPDVTLHVRSVFLQGLLVSPAERWPAIPGVAADGLVVLLDRLAAEAGFGSRAQLCVAYVLSHPWAHRLVIGSETQAQLRENLDRFDTRLLSEDECVAMRARLPALPDQLLDPSRWPRERKS
jgi:aryl-alcohol dehydrogenase-like predicted oxidoreductase